MPVNIDGTGIGGATIDGTEVQEITVDGDVVFTATPQVLLISLGSKFDVYELGTWNKLNTVNTSTYVNSIDINSAGNYAAVGQYKELEVYNTNDWSIEKEITSHQDNIRDVKFKPNDEYLMYVVNHSDSSLDSYYILDTANWSTEKTLNVGTAGQRVAISNNYVAGASNEQTAVWSFGNWNQQFSFTNEDFSEGIAIDDTGDNLVVTENFKPTRVYDTSTGNKKTELNNAAEPIFSPSGDKLLFEESSDVRVWDTTSTDPTNWTKIQLLDDGDVTYDACWADGGNYLVFTSRDNNTVYVYETDNWTLETTISTPSTAYTVEATI